MSRQNKSEMRKQKRLEKQRKGNQPKFKPSLCKRSLKVVTRSNAGTFLERMAKDALRKEHEGLKAKARRERDANCTFEPKINQTSRHLQGRTPAELSRGDSLKRETAQRLMRLKAEQEELAGLTFKPKLNSGAYSDVPGKLNIVRSPATYVERLQKERHVFNERRRKLRQELERREFDQCTFNPEIHRAPEYITRIAKSMQMARTARVQKSGRPDWK